MTLARFIVALAMAVLPSPAAAQAGHVHGPSAERQEASGTAWQPAATPMQGWHADAGAWTLMLHGQVFGQFLYESGEVHRTSRQAGSINWFMLMAERPLGGGRLRLQAMTSLEPATIGGCGYPNLLATGETCEGDTIHDRQHPHDFVMALAADYTRPLTDGARWQIYGGVAGEPALGPPGFPHRLSAFPNPIAPITHHWLDSTHITHGVVTTGVFTARWKAEGSLFNGREPDEGRWDLDLAAMDSYSARVTFAPAASVVLQVSAGHLAGAEAPLGAGPPTDVDRLTASAIVHRVRSSGATWATTLAWGRNAETAILPDGAVDQRTHALMLETSLTSAGPHAWFGRLDVAGKPAHDLHAHEFGAAVFTVGKLQGGYVRMFAGWKGLRPGVGGTVSLSLVPADLAPRYGGRMAPGAGVFVSLAAPRAPRS